MSDKIQSSDADECRRQIAAGKNIIAMFRQNVKMHQLMIEAGENILEHIEKTEASVREYEERLKALTGSAE